VRGFHELVRRQRAGIAAAVDVFDALSRDGGSSFEDNTVMGDVCFQLSASRAVAMERSAAVFRRWINGASRVARRAPVF
jgi:hypothetical protein